MKRGTVCWYTFKAPDKRRPVLVVTRDSAIPFLHALTVAPITRTIRRIPSEVVLDRADGVPSACAVNFDNLQTVPKTRLGRTIARLPASRMHEARAAMAFALGLDSER